MIKQFEMDSGWSNPSLYLCSLRGNKNQRDKILSLLALKILNKHIHHQFGKSTDKIRT